MSVPWIVVVSVLWIVVVGLSVMVAGLSTRVRELAAYTPTVPAGSPQSPFVVGPPIDVQLALPSSLTGPAETRSVGHILLFLHASCGPCRLFWDALSEQDDLDLQLAGVHRTLITDADGRSTFTGPLITDVVVQEDDEISRALDVGASPYGIALDSDGFVRWSGIPHRPEDVAAMGKALGRPREELLQTVWSPPSTNG